MERLWRARKTENLELTGGVIFARIEKNNGHYIVRGEDLDGVELEFVSKTKPILATGFAGSLSQVENLFERHTEKDYALLTESDESTVTPNLFLIGSQVRHDDTIFCFVYKFRQRFAVVANAIAERLKVDTSPLEEYRRRGMYLDDLSCCREQCATC